MIPLFARVTILVNNSNCVIEIKESRRFAPCGHYSYTIQLDPFDHKEIGATKFHQRSIDAGRPAILKIFVDGIETNKALTPQDLIEYAKISFNLDENGNVLVTGVKANKVAYIRRLWGLGFLLGRDYPGRPEVKIT